MHPKFNPVRVRTLDLCIMNSTFHVPEALILTAEPWHSKRLFKAVHDNVYCVLFVNTFDVCNTMADSSTHICGCMQV